MSSFAEGGMFLAMWIGYLALMILALGAVLVWAVRAGQFSRQDRARYLPLHSGIPDNGERKERREGLP